MVVWHLRPTTPCERVTRRTRAVRYGASIAVVVAGVVCGALIPGTPGGTAATVLVGVGLVALLSLIFYEVGLTEDRDRAAQGEAEESEERPTPPSDPRPEQPVPPPSPVPSIRSAGPARWIGAGGSTAGSADRSWSPLARPLLGGPLAGGVINSCP